jgi:cell wall-associated NlpC family hydrolase
MEDQQRAAVIAEAKLWMTTPYRPHARVKGAGADCMTFIAAVAESAGLISGFEPPKYSRQFGAHRSDETYLEGIMKFCREVEQPQPGDIAIWKAGRTFSHAGIVIDWPIIIHAHAADGVIMDNVELSAWFHGRPCKFFSIW